MRFLVLCLYFAFGSLSFAEGLNIENSVESKQVAIELPARSGAKLRVVFKIISRSNTSNYTLRTDLFKINHFFVSDLHVETHPKTNGRNYELQVVISKRFGEDKRIEEGIGSILIKDSPFLTANGLYTLTKSADLVIWQKGEKFKYVIEPVEATEELKDIAKK